MNIQQRENLSTVLKELDYPILSKHAITSENYLCETYVKFAAGRAVQKERYDLIAEMLFHKMLIA